MSWKPMNTPALVRPMVLLSILGVLVFDVLQARQLNGFDLDGALLPVADIEQGGPPRDGIPSLDHPRFVAAREATWLAEGDRVLGMVVNGVAKAYPIAILNWHEIVNDDFGGQPVVVSYCPLCGTGMAFSARVDGDDLEFGVSGLLYNSDVLLYDRNGYSLWSQLLGKAISGPRKGSELSLLPLDQTSWGDWSARHARTRVLSKDTGYQRDYDRDPYNGYARQRALWFAVAHEDQRFHPKEWVLGVESDGAYKAYPFSELAKAKTGIEVKDKVGGRTLRIEYDPVHRAATAYSASGEVYPAVAAYWFAWVAFHPETDVYMALAKEKAAQSAASSVPSSKARER